MVENLWVQFNQGWHQTGCKQKPETIAMAVIPSGAFSQLRGFGLGAALLAGTALASPAAAQSSFLGLGYLAPTGTPLLTTQSSTALALSANGQTVVGYSNVPDTRNTPGTIYGDVDKAFIWTAGTGMQAIPFLITPASGSDFPTFSRATAVSADGGVVVGWIATTETQGGQGPDTQAFRLVGGVTTPLGWLPGPVAPGFLPLKPLISAAQGVSGDGSIVVGSSYNSDGDVQAFRWTSGGGMLALPFNVGSSPGGSRAQANAISADGSTIVGFANAAATGSIGFADNLEAARWSGAGGGTITPLGFLNGEGQYGFSAATAVNATGGVIVGVVRADSSDPNSPLRAFSWTSGTMTALASLPGAVAVSLAQLPGNIVPVPPYPSSLFFYNAPVNLLSAALAITPDGSAIVGTAADSTSTLQAVRWNSSGVATISGLLTAAGVATTGWVLNTANGIAVVQNGQQQIITGTGTIGGFTQAWLARLGCGTSGLPACGITTPSALLQSVGQMPSAPAMAERITWGNQRESLLAAQRFGQTLGDGQPFTGFVSAHGAGWDPAARYGGQVSGSAGIVGRVTPWLRLGLSVSHDWENDQVATPKSKGIIWGTGGQVFALLGNMNAGPRLAATGGYEDMGAKIHRRYVNGSGTADGVGNTTGGSLGTAFRAAWGFALDQATTLSPFGQLNWQRTRFGSYAEGFAGNPFPAVLNGQSYESVVLGIGLEAERRYGWGRAWASANYSSRVVGGSGAMVSGRFVDLFSFNVRGVPVPERRWMETTIGGAVKLASNLELVANAGVILPTDSSPANSWHAYGSAALVMGF
jgi:probable HAF family extracellular repeat protein